MEKNFKWIDLSRLQINLTTLATRIINNKIIIIMNKIQLFNKDKDYPNK